MSKHMKRLASPRAWKIHKKSATWVPKPIAGAHATDASVPLGVLLRDYLGLVDTMPEARRVIGARDILVDGRPASSHKTPVGLMDVVSIPKMEKQWRIVIDHHGRIAAVDIPASAANWKFCRIENKTVVSGGRLQLNLHDGRNVIVKETKFKTGDVVKLQLPDQEIKNHYAFGANMTCLVTGGHHVGGFAKIQEVETIRGTAANLVKLGSGDTNFTTIKPYVFIVGEDKAEIKLPGGSA